MAKFSRQLNEVWDNFYFVDSEYLYGLWGAAFLLVLASVILGIRLYKRPERTYGSVYPFLGPMKFWLAMILFFSFGIMALARPSIAKGGVVPVKGPVEVIISAGSSFSEFAQDWGPSQPSRMEMAKREILNLFSSSALKKGDKVSFYVFANGSKRPMPLVDFEKHLDKFVGRVSSVLTLPKTIYEKEFFMNSSDVVLALEDIYQTLDQHEKLLSNNSNWKPSFRTNRLVFIFTDGDFDLDPETVENEQEKDRIQKLRERLNAALIEYRRRGLKIYAVGIGTRSGVRLTDILKKYSRGSDYLDQDEKELAEKGITRVNLNYLRLIVSGSRGDPRSDIYLLDEISDNSLSFLKKSVDSHRSVRIEPVKQEGSQELWQWFLAAAIIIFGLGWLMR